MRNKVGCGCWIGVLLRSTLTLTQIIDLALIVSWLNRFNTFVGYI